MPNDIITINQNAKLTLAKTKDLLDIVNKTLQKKKEKEIVQQTQEMVWIDPDTSLMWQVDVNDKGYIWEEAFEYAKSLNKEKYGGYDDWRVPNRKELKSILTSKSNKNSYGESYYIKKPLVESMKSVASSSYWSSTTYESRSGTAWFANLKRLFTKSKVLDAGNEAFAWNVYFYGGSDDADYKTYSFYVRCVRAGQ